MSGSKSKCHGVLASVERTSMNEKQPKLGEILVGQGIISPEDLAKALGARVVTTAGTLIKVIDRVEAQGYRVGLVVTVVDRQEGGSEALADKGYPLRAIFTKQEMLV